MDVKIIDIPTNQIKDWDSFHDLFQKELGFPDYYGRNMNAWIDCMDDLVDVVILKIKNASEFKKRCPEQHDALIECSAFVNYRRVEAGETPILTLMLIGNY